MSNRADGPPPVGTPHGSEPRRRSLTTVPRDHGSSKAPQPTTTMLLMIDQPGQKSDPAVIAHVRSKLARLETLLSIRSAHVTLCPHSRPSGFRATVQLEGPGPNLRGDEVDFTETAALDRAFANLKDVPAWHPASI